jgi:hypothetical protein
MDFKLQTIGIEIGEQTGAQRYVHARLAGRVHALSCYLSICPFSASPSLIIHMSDDMLCSSDTIPNLMLRLGLNTGP